MIVTRRAGHWHFHGSRPPIASFVILGGGHRSHRTSRSCPGERTTSCCGTVRCGCWGLRALPIVSGTCSTIGLFFCNKNFLNLFTATSLSLVYSFEWTARLWSAILRHQINIPHSLLGASCEDWWWWWWGREEHLRNNFNFFFFFLCTW